MSVEKRKSSSARYRASLARNITENGFVVMPCSYCTSQGLTCRMLPQSSRCDNCVRRGRSCAGLNLSVAQRGCRIFL
ncbi:hypothetical protein B0T21DRAFT_431997 [Apiosordaria backusii]|uniref:Uncharacterized protein n=1 Tax=Apiosordaria backusii TaxID=314023 RepID=A0AA39ZRS8_9PEZI|nr:hypothetical protein B0T21DRAFT_431997 [Apiosordaria backusii]